MKKRALSIFLLSILVISCFLYVFPLISLADTYIDSVGAFSLDNGSSPSNVTTQVVTDYSYATQYYYTSQTSWRQVGTWNNISFQFQLPSPFLNQSNVVYTTSKFASLTFNAGNGVSFFGLGYNINYSYYCNLLNITSDDYFCVVFPFFFNFDPSGLDFGIGEIVTGNAYQPTSYHVDDRFLIYNPSHIGTYPTSGIINTSLWSTPPSGKYACIYYINIKGSDISTYQSVFDTGSVIISFYTGVAGQVFFCPPVYYKCSELSGSEVMIINRLDQINDHVASIDQAVQSHVAPPTNYTDYSSIDQAEAQVSSKVNTIKNTLDDWALTTYISQGLSWVGAYTSYYFNEFGFIQAIYGIIVFFAIANVLRHGFFRTQRDYVTTDNYSVKGHNTQGDYEITGTRTTRRE